MAEEDEKDLIIQRLTRESAEHRKRASEATARVTELEGELAVERDKLPTELEKAKAEGAAEARASLGAEHATAIAAAEVRAIAARTLADPDDAPRFIDMTKVVKDGTVDPAAIEAELAALVERKPYLAAAAAGGGKPPPPTGNGDGGGRTPPPPQGDAAMDQMLRDHVKR